MKTHEYILRCCNL